MLVPPAKSMPTFKPQSNNAIAPGTITINEAITNAKRYLTRLNTTPSPPYTVLLRRARDGEAVLVEPAGNPNSAGRLITPVNILMATPRKSVEAKPTIMVAPKLVPKAYRTAQVIIVEMFESRIEGQ